MEYIENEELSDLLKKTKEIEYVAESLSYLNFGKIDIPEMPLGNFISEFSQRNKSLIHSLYFIITKNIEDVNNSKYTYNSDMNVGGIEILIIFALRDIIENIEVLGWLKLNNNKWFDNKDLDNVTINNEEDFLKLIENMYKNIDKYKHSEFVKKIIGQEKMKSYKISKSFEMNLESEIENKYGKVSLSKDFNYIEDLKKELHNYIHKNGLKYVNIKGVHYNQFLKDYLSKLLIIFKFYFKITFLLDGTCVSSSDYVDYLDCGAQPPEGCQYWVARKFDEYIHNQFEVEDKEWLKNNNTYNMQFEFLKK